MPLPTTRSLSLTVLCVLYLIYPHGSPTNPYYLLCLQTEERETQSSYVICPHPHS